MLLIELSGQIELIGQLGVHRFGISTEEIENVINDTRIRMFNHTKLLCRRDLVMAEIDFEIERGNEKNVNVLREELGELDKQIHAYDMNENEGEEVKGMD